MGCGSSRVGNSTSTIPHQSKTPIKGIDSPAIKPISYSTVALTSSNLILAEGSGESFKQKKKNLISSVNVFKEADERALQADSSLKSNITDLAKYLIEPFANSDLLKIRVLWMWITHNITYDVETYFNSSDLIQGVEIDSNNVLSTGKAVCSGYAGIFKSLAKIAEVKIESVSGWGKGYSYKTGMNLTEKNVNHSWNSVFLENSWWLLDSTWGAGYVDDNKNYIQEYNEHYFLTNPREFIFDHFPEDPTWQLIEPPITKEHYEGFAKFSKYFFQLNIKPVTHANGCISTDNGKLHMKFKVEKDCPVKCTGVLTKVGDEKGCDQYLHIYTTDKILHVLVNLPSQGEFNLKLFGCAEKEENAPLSLICSYFVVSTKEKEEDIVYPKQFKKWVSGFYLHSPMEGRLVVGKTYQFRISLPGVKEMAVCLGGKKSSWLRLPNTNGNIWEGDVLMEEGAERVNVVAKMKEQKNTTFSSVLEYLVVAEAANGRCSEK